MASPSATGMQAGTRRTPGSIRILRARTAAVNNAHDTKMTQSSPTMRGVEQRFRFAGIDFDRAAHKVGMSLGLLGH